ASARAWGAVQPPAFPVNNRRKRGPDPASTMPSPALMLRSRAHARGVSKHAGKGIARLILRDGASRLLRMRLPKAAPQAPRSLDRSLYFLVFLQIRDRSGP